MKPIIEVKGISKKYVLGAAPGRYVALRDVMANAFKRTIKEEKEEFWALNDISFNVYPGESIGVIGRNGAGKSTLLKILSKITPPTSGKIICRGRTASLLEVGTGFHPELTGRENIYLNGSILGLRRKEIDKQFDAIVDFSGVEKFLDTTLKKYSSGMQLRLAFAVAAHLEPEILVIDEVLAVGDAEFQKKCLGKMNEVSKSGRTILFVSHNMTAVRQLCTKAIFIRKGELKYSGLVDDTVGHYLTDNNQSLQNISFPIERTDVIIHNFNITQNDEQVIEFTGDSSIDLDVTFEVKSDLTVFRVGFFIKNQYGELLSRQLLADWNGDYENIKKGKYNYKSSIPAGLLTAGNYLIEVHTSRFGIIDYITDERTSTIIQVNNPTTFNPAHIGERSFGSIIWKHYNTQFHRL